MRYEVEVATTYYDVVEVEAPSEWVARARVAAGRGELQGGITYSNAEIFEVRAVAVESDRLSLAGPV